MSSISSVNSTTNPNQTTNQQSGYTQIAQNFQAIGSSLQSGDLSSAQSALAALQQALQGNSQSNSQTSSSQPFGKNSQANKDYQNLTSALQSGNLSTAQKAYASLQNDLKSAQSTKSAHKGHHHHHAASATSATASSTTPTTSSTSSSTVGSDGSLNVVA
jgi:outer membrane protein assembly factor BamD (BamD/ComL family)